MITVGDRVKFDPFEEITGFASECIKGKLVTGTVVYINHEHKWFSVEYGKPKLRTSFKFWQIGKDVKVCGKC